MDKEALTEASLFYVNSAFGGIAAGFFALGLNYFYQSNLLLQGFTEGDKSMLFGMFGIFFAGLGMMFTYGIKAHQRKAGRAQKSVKGQ